MHGFQVQQSFGENENKLYRKNINALKLEHDKYEARIKKMYEDKLDGRITDEMYDNLLREYKEKQAEVLNQMQGHSEADEQFCITANMTLNIAKRAKEIFMGSEVEEKHQLLGFLLQTCSLNGKKLDITMRSPFNLILDLPHHITKRMG